MRSTIFVLTLLLFAPLALAADADCTVSFEAETLDSFSASVDALDTALGECPQPVPGMVRMLVGTAPALEIGEDRFVFDIENGELTGISSEGDGSVLVRTSQETFESVLAAEEPLAAAMASYRDGSITIESPNPIRTMAIGIVRSISGWFS